MPLSFLKSKAATVSNSSDKNSTSSSKRAVAAVAKGSTAKNSGGDNSTSSNGKIASLFPSLKYLSNNKQSSANKSNQSAVVASHPFANTSLKIKRFRLNSKCSIMDSSSTLSDSNDIYHETFQSLVHYGDNIGAKIVKCLINENLYESQSLLNQEYDIYQVRNHFLSTYNLIQLSIYIGTGSLCNI